MAKIISRKWLDEDDPIFTGRVNISSPKRVAEEQAKYDKLMKRKYVNLTLTELNFGNEEDLV